MAGIHNNNKTGFLMVSRTCGTGSEIFCLRLMRVQTKKLKAKFSKVGKNLFKIEKRELYNMLFE